MTESGTHAVLYMQRSLARSLAEQFYSHFPHPDTLLPKSPKCFPIAPLTPELWLGEMEGKGGEEGGAVEVVGADGGGGGG